MEKKEELELLEEMLKKRCCSNDCRNKLPAELICSTCEQCRELQMRCDQHVNHLHLIMLGHFDACLQDSEKTCSSKHKNVDRSRTRLASTFHGATVCTDAFHFIHDISRRVTRDLKIQFEQEGQVQSINQSINQSYL